MKNLKEKNIQKVIWHMQRQFGRLLETSDAAAMKMNCSIYKLA